MKAKAVFAFIVVLLCLCPSFGKGDELLDDARKSLRRCYYRLIPFLKDPDTLRPGTTIYRHLREVNDKEKKWQNWLQKFTKYSLEQLNGPPGSFMTEDVLKLATEYHLWLSRWYYVRFITLDKAADYKSHTGGWYPRSYKCRNAALSALKQSQHHKDLYSQYHEALGENARSDIMNELQFPNYVASKKHQYQNAEFDAILAVRLYLEKLITRLLGTKMSMSSRSVKKVSVIKKFLKPCLMTLNEDFMSKIGDFFPVDDLSQPPDKASRSDGEFLELAWLLNQYRGLWYEIRHNEFFKFLRHWEQGLKAEFIGRLEEAMTITMKLFQRYESLSKDYHERFENRQPDSIVIAHTAPSTSDFMDLNRSIHIFEDDQAKQPKSLDGDESPYEFNRPTADLSDEEYLEDLFQPALENLYPSFLDEEVHLQGSERPQAQPFPDGKVNDTPLPESELLSHKRPYDMMEMNSRVNRRMRFSEEVCQE